MWTAIVVVIRIVWLWLRIVWLRRIVWLWLRIVWLWFVVWKFFNGDLLLSVRGGAKLLIMEDFVLMSSLRHNGDCVVLLVVLSDNINSLGNNWNFNVHGVLLDLINCAIFLVSDFIGDQDLSSVGNLVFLNVWNLEVLIVWLLIVDSHCEFLLDVVSLLFVFGDWNLLRDDVWDLLNHGVVNARCDLEGHLNVFLVGVFVDDSVWDNVGDDVWDLVCDGVGHLSAGDKWNLYLNFERHLCFDRVRNFDIDCISLKLLNFKGFFNILSHSDLVWDFGSYQLRDLLCDFIGLSHVVSDDIVVSIV